MAQNSFALMTNLGRAKEAAALANGTAIVITHIAIGDGTTVPSGGETALYNEIARKAISGHGTVVGASNVAYFDIFLAAAEGPYTIREAGLYDNAGDLIAIARYDPPINKPVPASGQTVEGTVRLEVAFSNIANVTIVVDPAFTIPLQRLSRLPWIPVLSMSIAAPPATPALGDAYVVPTGATGAWAGQSGKVAEYTTAGWGVITPPDGHGVSLPDGRVFEKVGGAYVEKPALDVQSGKWLFAIAAGSANNITATLTPNPATLVEGMTVCLKLSATNTGPVTLNLNGLGAKGVTDRVSSALVAGDLSGGEYALLRYDGAKWRVELTYGQLDRRYTRLPTPPANTFYVVGPTGNDNNSGLANTAADGFATIQGAIDAITRRYLTSGDITIRVANGNYDGFSLKSSFVSNWIIIGNEDNFGLVKVNALTSGINRGRGCSINAVNALIAGFEFKSLYENVSNNLGNVTVRNCNINLPSNADITAIGSYGGRLILEGRINIAGSGAYFLFSSQGAAIQVGYADAGGSTLVTLNYNNTTFSISNILAADCGTIFVSPSNVTINGSASGPRYNASTNGIIKTYGAGENFFPGSVAGGTWNGGQYV